MDVVFNNFEIISNALFPIIALGAGMSVGVAIVNWLLSSTKTTIENHHEVFRKTKPDYTAPPPRPVVEVKPAPRKEAKVDPNICRYCGNRLSWLENNCGKCGGPRG